LSGRDRWWLGAAAVASIAAFLISEGVLFGLLATDFETLIVPIAEILVGVGMPMALLSSGRSRLSAYIGVAVLGAIATPLVALGLPLVFRLAGSGHI
jgi:hypothetical protein